LVICGSNALTPLLPHYQDKHDLGSVSSAAIFSMYFLALMTVLLISARTSLVRHARTILPAALMTGMAADLLQIAGDWVPALLYPGRFLTGASVALSTGAAAAVMVAVRGERGRAFISTGSLLGAGGGLAVAMLIVVLLPAPSVTVYVLHVGALGICLATLVIGLRRSPWVLATGGSEVPLVPITASPRPHLRVLVRAHLLGGLSWAVGALSVGVLPVALLDRGVTDSLLVALSLAGSCLFATSLAGMAGLGTRRMRSAAMAAGALGVGWSIAAVGLVLALPVAVLAGCVVAGLGQAAGYGVGLGTLTRGLDPVRQGKVASGYSAVSYAGAGVFVLSAGASVAIWGTSTGIAVISAVYALCCAASVLSMRRVQHVPISADINCDDPNTAGQTVFTSARNLLN
jgi:hypothetical protein